METRRDYLIEKMQCKIDEGVRYSYLSEEIIALEKTMNFIRKSGLISPVGWQLEEMILAPL
jgi:hypothetical protein